MTDATDAEARQHMLACPDHDVTVGTDDEWHCLTCESGDDPAGPDTSGGGNA